MNNKNAKSPYLNCDCTWPIIVSGSGRYHEVRCSSQEVPISERLKELERGYHECSKKCCQPLTEGEDKTHLCFRHGGENHCIYPFCNCKCNACKPQESNKEEEFNTEWMKGKSLSELSKEPSKKPSERIDEIRQELKQGYSWANIEAVSILALMEYLDELHKSGKI